MQLPRDPTNNSEAVAWAVVSVLRLAGDFVFLGGVAFAMVPDRMLTALRLLRRALPLRSKLRIVYHALGAVMLHLCNALLARALFLRCLELPTLRGVQAQRRYREFVALHDGLRGEVSGLPHHFPVWPFHLNRLAPEVVDSRRLALCSYLSAALAALHGGVMPARLRSFLQLPQAQANRMTAPAGPSGAAPLLPLFEVV